MYYVWLLKLERVVTNGARVFLAGRVHKLTQVLVSGAESSGHRVESRDYFDTVRLMVGDGNAETVVRKALENGINIRLYGRFLCFVANGAFFGLVFHFVFTSRVDGSSVCIALDETTSEQDIDALLSALGMMQTAPVRLRLCLEYHLQCTRRQVVTYMVYERGFNRICRSDWTTEKSTRFCCRS